MPEALLAGTSEGSTAARSRSECRAPGIGPAVSGRGRSWTRASASSDARAHPSLPRARPFPAPTPVSRGRRRCFLSGFSCEKGERGGSISSFSSTSRVSAANMNVMRRNLTFSKDPGEIRVSGIVYLPRYIQNTVISTRSQYKVINEIVYAYFIFYLEASNSGVFFTFVA